MGNELRIIEAGEDAPLALDLPKDQGFDEWAETGRNLASANKVLNWWIGDWWAAGTHRYGARANVAAQGIFGREFATLVNLATVCRSFETPRRRGHLTFSHHAEVASLSPAQADGLLDRAEKESWSVRELRAHAMIVRDSHQSRWFDVKKPTHYDRDAAKEAVFNRLSEAATSGEICPTADELAEIAGVESVSTTVALMHSLEADGRIKVDRYQKSRSVTIVETGASTADPPNRTPHWRECARDVPTPPTHVVNQRAPNIAQDIWAMAKRKGKSPQEYLVELIMLGWEVECARDSDDFRAVA